VEEALLNKKLFATAALVLTFVVPAAAQPIQYMDRTPMQGADAGALPPQEVMSAVRSHGFNPLAPPHRRGDTYVVRSSDRYGREVRVIVDAYEGGVIGVRPSAAASAVPPGGSVGAYEPMPGPRGAYAERGPAPGYRSAPPAYEGERPINRPPAAVPSAPPSARYSSVPPSGARGPVESIPSDPQVIPAPEARENGLLPPPPERFPQRATPSQERAKPAQPPRRAASAAPPRSSKPPLPKPRPEAAPSASAPTDTPAAAAPSTDASPMPPPIPESKPDDEVPH
jgi:hypothetical protein